MRIVPALALLLFAAPVLAQPPAETPPAPVPAPAPAPTETAPIDTAPAPADGTPKIDPAYGEHPDHDGSSEHAPGDHRHVGQIRRGQPIVVRYHPDRSKENIRLLAITAGAGALLGAVGLYFHLDSRSLSEQVSLEPTCLLNNGTLQCFPTQMWSEERRDIYDRANRSASIATVSYGIGGALLLASAIIYMVTEPELETRTIQPHENGRPQALLAPTPGGAMVGGAWRF